VCRCWRCRTSTGRSRSPRSRSTGRDSRPRTGLPAARTRSYEIDFEIKEILTNSAINAAQATKNAAFLTTFEDFTDIRNAVIIIMYPGAAAVRSKTFTGVEITDQEGGFSDSEDAEPIGIKCSGFATGATGVF